MSTQSLSQLAGPTVVKNALSLVAHGNRNTAAVLAHFADIDARRLYRPEGYPSMFAWCVGAAKLSEDAAARLIRAARLARRFPLLLPMVEDGRLTLAALGLLAPHLVEANAAELLTAAAGKTNRQVEQLLAEHFPRPDVPTVLCSVAAPTLVMETRAGAAVAPGPVQGNDKSPAALRVTARNSNTRTTPLGPGRHLLQVTLPDGPHEKLCYAQALLGHAVPSGDLVEVLDRLFGLALAQLEKQKCGAGSRSRSGRRRNPDSRYIPLSVRRVVWERDGGRCTFVSDKGHRCEANRLLEFDHIEPFARGGEATPSQLRLRCRAHNQYAERTYGAGFMRFKRADAKQRAAERRAKAEKQAAENARKEQERAERARKAQEREAAKARQEQERAEAKVRRAREDEVIPALNALGLFGQRARWAASLTGDMVDATLEERIKRALTAAAPPCVRYSADGRRMT